MATLTERERILRTYRHQEVDRIPMLDKAWAGTKRRWYAEGMPQNVTWEDFFGFDHRIQLCPDNSPRFEKRILEENDRYKIVTTSWGSTQKKFRELDSTPETISFYYDTPEKWEEAKKAMLTYHEDRIPWDYLKENYPKWKAEGRFIQLILWFGFDVAHSRLTGTENMLITMMEDPDWAMDIYDTYLKTSLDLCQRILDAGYEFDGVFWYDDMGYKGTPFFSAQTYRELLKPFHKKAVDWAHERGMVAELHSCGFIEPLLPDILDTGVDMLNPLEIKAGMDPQKLKQQYGGKLGFHGGINAQLWDDIDLVKAEMERIIPLMKEGGGYIFASDHSIPNSVSLENMKEISELAHRLGRY
jgi:uroporphyrinogen decarboxylase